MVDFNKDVVAVVQEARAFIAETGGLPEIDRASLDFRNAIEQTRLEIKAATIAVRFPRKASGYFDVMSQTGTVAMTPRAQEAVEQQGEAGFKREGLRVELARIESSMGSLVSRLVELRCDLAVSQWD